MQVILAKSAGFCYGVKRAVELARKTAEESNGAWMLGDLIHNTHVVEELARSGIRKATDPSSIQRGETVVIRSHGELKSVIDLLEGKGAYTYPGFTKVVQAAGRVIRTEEDKGVLVLVDNRYLYKNYKLMFPHHWKNIKTIKNLDDISKNLDAFWFNKK